MSELLVHSDHPQELAQDTLQTLSEYLPVLENLCGVSANLLALEGMSHEFHIQFGKLVEGITTFTDAMSVLKKVLRIHGNPKLERLEKNLFAALKGILVHHELREALQIQELLRLQLCENIIEWQLEGIPYLQRSRDS